jgi:hypothetical protein
MDNWRIRQGVNELTTCPLCRAHWRNPDPNLYHRSDLDVDAFETYCEWLHEGHIVLEEEEHSTTSRRKEWKKLVDVYTLGVAIKSQAFRADILGAILELCHDSNKIGCLDSYIYIYDQTKHGSGLRRFAVELLTRHGSKKALKEHWDEFSGQMHKDLACCLIDNGKVSGNWNLEDMKKRFDGKESDEDIVAEA